MDRLVEELELHNCNYLNEPGGKEQVKELVREYQDIFTDEEKKGTWCRTGTAPQSN